jgi:glycosyltransferase involved in cell wall biosynthesis
VLRQISVLQEFGDVTVVGFGPAPDGVDDYLEVPRGLKTLPQTLGGVINLALHRFKEASEIAAPALRWTFDRLKDREFDLVVANEARVLGLAHRLAKGAPVWGDMHEWSPGERTHIFVWRVLVAPFMTYLCREFLPRSAAVTAVSGSVAKLYDQTFGIRTIVLRNAGPYRDLPIRPLVDGKIRLVHSGMAVHGRNIELMIDVVRKLDQRYTLDIYLMPGNDKGAYLNFLKERTGGDARITFHDPVPPQTLPDVINAYDVGVFWLPPVHLNARYTLPNKFYDFVQARLAIAVGPTVEMAALTEKHHLGVVSDGFEIDQCVASMALLGPDEIMAAKKASDLAARELSFETEGATMRALLTDALSRGR